MPPTTKSGKFYKMLKDEESDLTKALDILFTDPAAFEANYSDAANMLKTDAACLDALPNAPNSYLVDALTDALGQVNNAPYDPPDVPKVIEHINNWPITVPGGNGKRDVRETLALVLDPIANPGNNPHGVKSKWKLYRGEGEEIIDIDIKLKNGVIQKPVVITFLNSWEKVRDESTGEVHVTVG